MFHHCFTPHHRVGPMHAGFIFRFGHVSRDLDAAEWRGLNHHHHHHHLPNFFRASLLRKSLLPFSVPFLFFFLLSPLFHLRVATAGFVLFLPIQPQPQNSKVIMFRTWEEIIRRLITITAVLNSPTSTASRPSTARTRYISSRPPPNLAKKLHILYCRDIFVFPRLRRRPPPCGASPCRAQHCVRSPLESTAWWWIGGLVSSSSFFCAIPLPTRPLDPREITSRLLSLLTSNSRRRLHPEKLRAAAHLGFRRLVHPRGADQWNWSDSWFWSSVQVSFSLPFIAFYRSVLNSISVVAPELKKFLFLFPCSV